MSDHGEQALIEDLGTASDREVAERHSTTAEHVRAERLRRHIPGIRMRGDAIDWRGAKLGELPDREVAAQLGCSVGSVQRRRGLLGIPSYEQAMGVRKKLPVVAVDWDAQPLGQVSDGCLAAALTLELGVFVHPRRVDYARRKRGIKPGGYQAFAVDWAAVHFEGRTDREVAEELGVAEKTVATHRRKLGIRPFKYASRLAAKVAR